MKFTANLNESVEHEWEVFIDGEIFCHLSDSDFWIFIDNFKQEVTINKEELK